MEEKIELLEAAVANRGVLYRMAWRVLASEPDQVLVDALANPDVRLQAEVFFGQDSRGLRAYDGMAKAFAETDLDRLTSDFTKLLIGPGSVPAPPWESVYTSPDELLFQRSTLEVRQAFKAAGFKSKGYPHEADDHAATELDFMAQTCDAALAALAEGDVAKCANYLRHQAKFLAEHLNRWLPAFADRMKERAPESVGNAYVYAAYFAAELCACDAQVLEDLLA